MNPNEPIRDARKLGTPKMLVLGLQHMFAMFGATILVPILVQQYRSAPGHPDHSVPLPASAPCSSMCAPNSGCLPFWAPPLLPGGFSTLANMNTGIYADMSPPG